MSVKTSYMSIHIDFIFSTILPAGSFSFSSLSHTSISRSTEHYLYYCITYALEGPQTRLCPWYPVTCPDEGSVTFLWWLFQSRCLTDIKKKVSCSSVLPLICLVCFLNRSFTFMVTKKWTSQKDRTDPWKWNNDKQSCLTFFFFFALQVYSYI